VPQAHRFRSFAGHREAARRLARSTDGTRRPILDEAYVVDLGAWAQTAELKLADGVVVAEIEDLLSPTIVAAAARGYAVHLIEVSDDKAAGMTAELVAGKLADPAGGRMWSALEIAFSEVLDGAHIDKVGFAKEVVSILERVRDQHPRPPGLPDVEHNFERLLADLAQRLSRAASAEADRRSNRRTDRIVRSFLRDFPDAASRDAADELLRELEASLELTTGDDAVRADLIGLRRDFKLNTDPLTPVPDFEEFRRRVSDLKTRRRLAYRPEGAAPRPAAQDDPPAAEDAQSG
jgi:hypothetical protein